MEQIEPQPYDHVEWHDERLLKRAQEIAQCFRTTRYSEERAQVLVHEWLCIDFETNQRTEERGYALIPPKPDPPKRTRKK